jgi:hypothetical protein
MTVMARSFLLEIQCATVRRLRADNHLSLVAEIERIARQHGLSHVEVLKMRKSLSR